MREIAIVLGSIVGSAYDPVIWLITIIGLGIGLWQRPWWWGGLLAIGAFLVRLNISSANRTALGLELGPWPVVTGIVGVFYALIAFGLGKGLVELWRSTREPLNR